MGKSAKLHKRMKKTVSSTSTTQNAKSTTGTTAQSQSQSQSKPAMAKKRHDLKSKTAAATQQQRDTSGSKRRKDGEHVLGGADYVDMLMGSRKKAREEAAKLTIE